MATGKSLAQEYASATQPAIRRIGPKDLMDALAKGLDDFKAKPSHLLLLVLIYPLVGIFLIRYTFGQDILPLVFPLIAGFTLIGPVAAVGLYEISRRRELGLDISWRHAFDVFQSPSVLSIAAIGLLQMMIYFAWLGTALIIYEAIFGSELPDTFIGFAREIFTTPKGWQLIVIGSAAGSLFAVLVLAISAVSFPLLLDKDVGARVAVQTSLKAFQVNPGTMLLWGAIVGVTLGLGALPLFVGLAVAMPVLGHATWHLYRKVVET